MHIRIYVCRHVGTFILCTFLEWRAKVGAALINFDQARFITANIFDVCMYGIAGHVKTKNFPQY